MVPNAAKAKPSVNAELARAESEGRYDVIVSCVDKGKSRQDIQGLRPRLIIGGSTTGLTAKTNVYDFAPCPYRKRHPSWREGRDQLG
jgi:hypothetical protein